MSNNKIDLNGHGLLEKKLSLIVCEILRHEAINIKDYKDLNCPVTLVFKELGLMADVFNVKEYDSFGDEIYYEVEVWDDFTDEERASIKNPQTPTSMPAYSFSRGLRTSFILSSKRYELDWFLVL